MQLPASASQTLYSRREAEAGSTSNYVISETSNSEMLLTAVANEAAPYLHLLNPPLLCIMLS